MKRLAKYLLVLSPKIAFATGVLNVLLAAGILPLNSSVSPTSVSTSAPSSSLTTPSTTCSGTGGVLPYSYSWSFTSGGVGITINSPSSATTSFSVTGAAVNWSHTGTAQCQLSDFRGHTSDSNVSVTLNHIPLFPPSIGTATLVAGSFGPQIGYDGLAPFGSLSPTVDYNSHTVAGLVCTAATGGFMDLTVSQPSSNFSYITDLSINGTLYAESGATYSYNGTYGTWAWNISCPMSSGSTYNVFYY